MKAIYSLKNVWILCLATCSLLASSDPARFSPTPGSAHYRDSSLDRNLSSAMVVASAESSPELVIEEDDTRSSPSLEGPLAPDQGRYAPRAVATLPQMQAQEIAVESLTKTQPSFGDRNDPQSLEGDLASDQSRYAPRAVATSAQTQAQEPAGESRTAAALADAVGSTAGALIPSPGFPFLLDMDATVMSNAWIFAHAGQPLQKIGNQIFVSPSLFYSRYCSHTGKVFSRSCGYEERSSEPSCWGSCKPAFSGFLAEFAPHQGPITSEVVFTDDTSLPPYSWLFGFIKHSKEQLNLNAVNQIKIVFFSPPLALDEHYAGDLRELYQEITNRRNIVSFVEQPARINIFATRRQWWGLSIDLPHKMYDNNAAKGRRIRRYYIQALHRWAFRQEALRNEVFKDEEEALEKIGLDCSGTTLWTSLLALFGGYHRSAIVVD